MTSSFALPTSIHRALSVSIMALLLLTLALPAQAAAPQRDRHDQTVSYWTADRMASAQPRDFTLKPGRGFVPAAKPEGTGKPDGAGGGGKGGGKPPKTTNVSGAPWNGGGVITEASGKVYFEMNGSAYVCSGAVATDTRTDASLVLTAAHCAYDETSQTFASRWLFVPNFDAAPTFNCDQSKYGCWTASALVVHSGYANAGAFNSQAAQHDFAFAVVGPGGKTGQSAQLDETVGSLPISFATYPDRTRAYAFGYPAQAPYTGRDLTYCAGPTFSDPYNSGLTYGLTCNMTGGSSGGPWLTSFSETTGSGVLSSVNSYGYSGINAMHGPKFNDNTQDVYTTANAATTNVVVP